MNGAKLMQSLRDCDQARRNIPMELQATLPLVGRKRKGTAECWYYRLSCTSEGVTVYSPVRYVVWEIVGMTILQSKQLDAAPLGSGQELLSREHREKEDAYLAGLEEDAPQTAQWLAAAPAVLRGWLEKQLKEA